MVLGWPRQHPDEHEATRLHGHDLSYRRVGFLVPQDHVSACQTTPGSALRTLVCARPPQSVRWWSTYTSHFTSSVHGSGIIEPYELDELA